MRCETCDGTHMIDCGNCGGRGSVPIDDGDHDGEEDITGTPVTCPGCHGTREIECPNCDEPYEGDEDDEG